MHKHLLLLLLLLQGDAKSAPDTVLPQELVIQQVAREAQGQTPRRGHEKHLTIGLGESLAGTWGGTKASNTQLTQVPITLDTLKKLGLLSPSTHSHLEKAWWGLRNQISCWKRSGAKR